MTPQIAAVLSVIGITIILFAFEVFRVDVIAILIMLSLAWLRLIRPEQVFSGFASNAVVAIIAVMILCHGLESSGVVNRIARPIMRISGASEKRLIGFVSAIVGALSAFMQNIGAVALFLPAMVRISRNRKISSARLLMPMGFAAILGGTLSMVGSGPLIILNDLLKQGGQKPFGLFSVTPVGAALLGSGILYFLFLGKYILPVRGEKKEEITPQEELIETWRLSTTIYRCLVPENTPLIGKTREDARLWKEYSLNLLVLAEGGEVIHAPWRHTRFAAGQELAMLGNQGNFERFMADFRLQPAEEEGMLQELLSPENAGFSEIIIRPRASVAGKTLREIAMRKNYGVEPILLLTGIDEQIRDFSDKVLEPGDTIIVHGCWENIKRLGADRDFVLVTPVAWEEARKGKALTASLCFLAAILLAFSGIQLSLALLSGALAMVLLRVFPMDEAYKAVDWRTVFLLAGLIPLGVAMERTGAARYVSGQMIQVLHGSHPLLIMMAIAALSTLFSLFMSNVATTVLLVPLVIQMAGTVRLDPRILALLVAVSASNSFLLPTHQVNALIMAPGGYHNADFLRAGGIMTLLFIGIASGIFYFFYM